MELTADDDALELIAGYSSGDCRNAYNTLEVAAQLGRRRRQQSTSRKPSPPKPCSSRVLMYDKSGEEHYNLISALHKSVRNSDPDAALYWLGRMFAGGEDPLYLARRIVRMAVEDIGLAAPEALNLCLSAKETIDFLGSPEGDLALAEAVVYLCARAQIERRLHGLRRSPGRHRAHAPGAGAAAPAQRAHAPDEGARLRQRLSLRARRRRQESPTWTACPTRSRAARYYQPTQEGREKQLAARMEEIRRIRIQKRLKE